MPFNLHPMVSFARNFGKKFNAKQVIILFITDDEQLGYASYGETPILCSDTQALAETAYKAIYESFIQK